MSRLLACAADADILHLTVPAGTCILIVIHVTKVWLAAHCTFVSYATMVWQGPAGASAGRHALCTEADGRDVECCPMLPMSYRRAVRAHAGCRDRHGREAAHAFAGTTEAVQHSGLDPGPPPSAVASSPVHSIDTEQQGAWNTSAFCATSQAPVVMGRLSSALWDEQRVVSTAQSPCYQSGCCGFLYIVCAGFRAEPLAHPLHAADGVSGGSGSCHRGSEGLRGHRYAAQLSCAVIDVENLPSDMEADASMDAAHDGAAEARVALPSAGAVSDELGMTACCLRWCHRFSSSESLMFA